MLYRILIFLSFVGYSFCFIIGSSYSTEEKPMRISLEESVEIASKNNYQLRIAMQEKVKARGKISEAYSDAYPHLDLTGNYTHLGKLTTAEFAGETFTLGTEDAYVYDLSLKQAIYRGGKTGTAIRIAELYSNLADETYLDVEQLTIFSAKKSYFDVLLSKEFYTVTEESLKLAEDHLDYVKKHVEQGIMSNYDLLRAQVQYSNEKAQFLKAKNAYKISQTNFLRVLGLPLDTEFELTDRLEHKKITPDFDKALATALEMRPAIKEIDLKLSMQKQNIRIVKGDRLPSVYLSGTWEAGNASRFSFGGEEYEGGWYAGVLLEMPIFDGFKVKSKLKQEYAALQQFELQKQDLEKEIELEIKQAILNLQDAEEFVESQRQNVDQAREGLRQTEKRFENGLATELDVLQSRTSLTIARSNYAQAVYNHNIAKLSLDKAMGTITK